MESNKRDKKTVNRQKDPPGGNIFLVGFAMTVLCGLGVIFALDTPHPLSLPDLLLLIGLVGGIILMVIGVVRIRSHNSRIPWDKV